MFGVCISDPEASGTKVWIHHQGAFAEYVCAPESMLATKPDNVTFEQAASAPVAAFTALQGLRDKGQIQSGQKVLINGAAGGVGTFAIQIAKSSGAVVTGVCSTRNLDMVKSIGADHVIDYTAQDFTKRGERYDLLFDCVGNHSLAECRRALGPNGSGSRATGGRRITFREVLLGVQIAICAVLVTSSLVAVRGMMRSLHSNFGFDPQNAMLMDTDLNMAGYRGTEVSTMQKRIVAAMEMVPASPPWV